MYRAPFRPSKNKKVTTRSAAEVTAKVTAQKKMVQIDDAVKQFPKEKFVKMDVAGDGHCIINSIIMGLGKNEKGAPSKEMILENMHKTLQENIDKYSDFIGESDPFREIELYKKTRYSTATADLIIPLISDMLEIVIIVLKVDEEKDNYQAVSTMVGNNAGENFFYVLK